MTAVTVALVLTAGALALPLASASASHSSPEPTYTRYAKVRDQLKACAVDLGWNHLGPEKRKRCPRLRRRYTLYSFAGSPGTTFFRCKTRRCPAQPIGVPNPRGAIPAGAVVIF